VHLSTRGGESCAGHRAGGKGVRAILQACPAAGSHYQAAPRHGCVVCGDDWDTTKKNKKNKNIPARRYIPTGEAASRRPLRAPRRGGLPRAP